MYFHIMLSVHGVKMINTSYLANITWVNELFPVEVKHLRHWFEVFGFYCDQAVKVHSWTLYLLVNLAQIVAELSRFIFMVAWVWKDEEMWVE